MVGSTIADFLPHLHDASIITPLLRTRSELGGATGPFHREIAFGLSNTLNEGVEVLGCRAVYESEENPLTTHGKQWSSSDVVESPKHRGDITRVLRLGCRKASVHSIDVERARG